MAFKVEFKKSGKTLEWNDKADNLLELAEDGGVDIEYECRQGFCGACKTRLLSGDVSMETTEGLEPGEEQDGLILPCVAAPDSDLVLDA